MCAASAPGCVGRASRGPPTRHARHFAAADRARQSVRCPHRVAYAPRIRDAWHDANNRRKSHRGLCARRRVRRCTRTRPTRNLRLSGPSNARRDEASFHLHDSERKPLEASNKFAYRGGDCTHGDEEGREEVEEDNQEGQEEIEEEVSAKARFGFASSSPFFSQFFLGPDKAANAAAST
jgi:hypothetical protein